MGELIIASKSIAIIKGRNTSDLDSVSRNVNVSFWRQKGRREITVKSIAKMSSGGGDRPTVMVTNDDGIDAPGIRALLHVLVSSNRFNVYVCAPDSYVFHLTLVSPSAIVCYLCVREREELCQTRSKLL